MGNAAQPFAGFVGQWFGRANGQLNFDASHTPGWLAAHDFGYVQVAAGQVDAVALGKDGHRRDDTSAERVGQQIGWREGFAPALVVGGCIGQNNRTRLKMRGFGAKIARVASFDGSHWIRQKKMLSRVSGGQT